MAGSSDGVSRRVSGKTSGKGEAKPSTPADMRLRIKHTEDSITYNKAHARDHAAAVKQAQSQLSQTRAQLKKVTKKK